MFTAFYFYYTNYDFPMVAMINIVNKLNFTPGKDTCIKGKYIFEVSTAPSNELWNLLFSCDVLFAYRTALSKQGEPFSEMSLLI